MTVDLKPKGSNFIDCKTVKIPLEVEATNGSNNDYSFIWRDENKAIIQDSINSVLYVTYPMVFCRSKGQCVGTVFELIAFWFWIK